MSESQAGMTRIDRAAWAATSMARRWLIASRAEVIVLTLQSALVGGLLALSDGIHQPGLWLLCVVGLALAHAANNQLNDYVDYHLGIDTSDYFRVRYGTHVLHDGLMTASALRWIIVITGGLALVVGIVITLLTTLQILWFIAAGGICLLFYTWPMKRLGLGEIAVWLVWGPLMIAGTDWVLRGHLDIGVVFAGGIFGLSPMLVIFGKHIDKGEMDAARGVATLPVRLGAHHSRQLMIGMLVALYAGTAALVLTDVITPWSLLTIAALPSALRLTRACQTARPAEEPKNYPEGVWPLWYVAFAFGFSKRFGIWLIAGLVAGVLAG